MVANFSSLRPVAILGVTTVYVEEEINALQDRISGSVETVSDKIEASSAPTLDKMMNINTFKIIDTMRRKEPQRYANALLAYHDLVDAGLQSVFARVPAPSDSVVNDALRLIRARL